MGDYESVRNWTRYIHGSNASECKPNITSVQLSSSVPSTILSAEDLAESSPNCSMHHDGILCWPETPIGETASLPCLDQLYGIHYNTSGEVTRFCEDNGTWNKSDYSNCKHLFNTTTPVDNGLDITTGVYFFGYCFSLVALIAASIIFIAFKELRCLRNRIHSHLIITYIMADALWIISFVMGITSFQSTQAACVTFILLHYFHLTNFFWMLVEGLYLYVLVVQTFMAESIKFRIYSLIGWGIPSIVVIAWSITKWMTMVPRIPSISPIMDADLKILNCPWFHVDEHDWIYKASALLVLAANMLFLLQIMWVLITKLRSATTPETQQSKKAAKALVVLMPLLGITYVLVLIGPKKLPTYEHIRAFLISTQGFLVALLYCFLNAEVRLQFRIHWARIGNIVGPSWICCGWEEDVRQQMQQMRDWSPRSRTESIRLCAPNAHGYRKRESSASETTTVTGMIASINGNGNNGSQQAIPLCSRKISSTNPLQSNPLFELRDDFSELEL